MTRLAFVVQRYGSEVNGGAEALCRWVAERMKKYFTVDVLTTCAFDYLSWANHYPAGTTEVNGLTVRRFPTDQPRNMDEFNHFARKLLANPQHTLADELMWLRLQGPSCPALLTYIKEHEADYALFVFVTYSYLTTFLGLQLVPRKSVLIPAAHDEPHFHFTAFQPLFHLPKGLIYNTAEERRLVQSTWQNAHIPSCVAGAGVENGNSPAAESEDAPLSFPEPYLLYFGRVDVMKGCQNLVHFFCRYLEERGADAHLVLMGKQAMEIPEHPHLHAPGFVSDTQKEAALQQAALVVNPSEYESLSLMILEAWQLGAPVLVNGLSDVMVEHCLHSNGGLYYTNYDEFALCLDLLLSNADFRAALGKRGQHYVEQQYSWDTVEKKYVKFFSAMNNRQ